MTRLRWAVGALGVVMAGVGCILFLTGVPSRQWLEVAVWLAGGVAAHDAVVAPVAVLVGLVALPLLPLRARPVARSAALALATVALLGLPLLATL